MKPNNTSLASVKLSPTTSSLDKLSIPTVASWMKEPCQLVLLFSVCRSLIGAYSASMPRA